MSGLNASNGKINFSVDSRLVHQLGEQLVPSDQMALAELVKNSYDADATRVEVEYSELDGEALLRIADNGSGMNLMDLNAGWFTLGTAGKQAQRLSPVFGRVRVGQKGVGRFASQRLGSHLSLKTKVRDALEWLLVDIDWTTFDAGTALGSLEFSILTAPGLADEHGTELIIRGVRREWTLDQFSEVLSEVVNLRAPVSPRHPARGESRDPGFELEMDFMGEKVAAQDPLQLLSQSRVMTVEGSVDAAGRAVVRLLVVQPSELCKEEEYPKALRTGPLHFSLELFVMKRRFIGEFGVRNAQKVLRDHGGVRVWRDGFRVFPYGQSRNDWLGLDAHVAARRPPLNMWRNQQITGGVFITQEDNPQLIDLITRNGLVANEEYLELRDLLYWALTRAANWHSVAMAEEGRTPKPRPADVVEARLAAFRAERTKHAAEVRAIIESGREEGRIDAALADRVLTLQAAAGASAAIEEDRIVEEAHSSQAEILDELGMLRVLASLGAGLAAFAHEIRMVAAPLANVLTRLGKLEAMLPSGSNEAALAQASAAQLRRAIGHLDGYRGYIDEFVSARAVRRTELIEMQPFVAHVMDSLGPLLDRNAVTVELDVPAGLYVGPMHPAELSSVMFNLVTNAVKAMRAPGVTERRLRLAAASAHGAVEFIVADTGAGVPDEVGDKIFEPFVSLASPGDTELGQGTGLGLTIARRIITSLGGDIALASAPSGYKTAFQVTIPVR